MRVRGVLRPHQQRAGRGEQLTGDEQFQFRLRSNALFRYWEDVHYQYRLGLYDEEEYSRQKARPYAPNRRNSSFVMDRL